MFRFAALGSLLAALPLSAAPAAQFEPAATAINQVGIDLLRSVAAANPQSNLLLSPYSIETALALAYAGAAGDTRAEMAKALHFPTEESALEASFAALREDFAKALSRQPEVTPEEEAEGENGPSFQLGIANRLYAERRYAIRDSFLSHLKRGYDATIELRDFERFPDSARTIINDWVAQQTRDRIKDLIPERGVGTSTRLVLVNALYLRALWREPFEPDATQPRPFYLAPDRVSDVPTMHKRSVVFNYGRFDNFVAVTLPYIDSPLQCSILLPDEDSSPEAILSQLTPELLSQLRPDLLRAHRHDSSRPIDLFLPKFHVAAPTLALTAELRKLGMKTAFDQPSGSANFDGIHPRRPNDYLALSAIFHQTSLDLDEKGTEAAAATAVSLLAFGVMMGPPPPPIVVRVDRPFLFVIQHTGSGACLFIGRITDPR